MMNTYRPTAVTVISWYLVISGGLGLLAIPLTDSLPYTALFRETVGISPGISTFLGILGTVVYIVAGVAMLRRQRWGRDLFLVGVPLVMIISLIANRFALWPFTLGGLLVYLLCAYFLTRHENTEYFLAPTMPPAEPLPEGSDVPLRSSIWSRVGAVVFLVIGGFVLTLLFMTVGAMSESMWGVVIFIVILGPIASGFLYGGIRLWNREKWALLLGVVFLVVSLYLGFVSYLIYWMATESPFAERFAAADPGTIENMARGGAIMAVAALLISGLLFLLNRKSAAWRSGPEN